MAGFGISFDERDQPGYWWRCLKRWWKGPPQFKPCVLYSEEMRLTQVLLEDCATVSVPWGPYQGHAVDCMYTFDGRLVGIQIWDDVRVRKARVSA